MNGKNGSFTAKTLTQAKNTIPPATHANPEEG